MASITIESVSKVYSDGTRAVSDVDLHIDDGMLMVLVGPSGCGKTTLLRMVAGLESITDGTLRIGDRVVNRIPPQQRDIAMVFQGYALYPHMNVYSNIAYGLRRRKLSKQDIDRRVLDIAALLELTDLLEKKPAAISGGQRQRVAMGRAIVRQPQAFLMDEPLSNLDAKLRTQMRTEIARLQQDLGTTTIYVTHDQVEAMTLGDLVAVMHKGEVQQVADPQTLFNRPDNLFVANFIGSPSMNVLAATLQSDDGTTSAVFGPHRVAVPDAVMRRITGLSSYRGRRVALGIRPEDVAIANGPSDAVAACSLTLPLELRETFGRIADLHFNVQDAVVPDAAGAEASTGSQPPRTARSAFVARVSTDAAGGTDVGAPVRLVLKTDALHFFDPETGATIT